MSKNQKYFKSIFPKFICNMGEWGKVKNFWHTNQHQQYLIAFFLHSNCHSPNPHSCAFSIVTCDRKNEEKMRVGSTNISPNIGYSGRKEPWTIPLHNSSTSVYIVKALNIYIVATTAAAFRVMVLLFHSKEGIHKKDAFQEFPSLEKKRGKPKT